MGLRKHCSIDILKSSKTLLKTKQSAKSESFGDGTYCHVGMKKILLPYLSTLTKMKIPIPKNLILDFNIDEVSCSKSTQSVLWLIQMSIRDTTCNPFVIGAFHGRKKPKCNELLKHYHLTDWPTIIWWFPFVWDIFAAIHQR